MAITPIDIISGGFQTGTEALTGQAAASTMNFVNDGYTVLYVNNTSLDTVTQITITGISDNAARTGNPHNDTITFGTAKLFGPFRPLWWNQAGVVNIAFDNTADVFVTAIKLQF